ncbi:Ku protein [Legionella sp.]|uniref:non-homologous end joining protein Ku n=1 Tax=Legionella sp. TaxID=459 RepID=UPI003CA4F482
MSKSIWKGELSFGLVAIPVSLVSTEEHHDLHFHLLDAKTNSRIRYQRINEENGKEVDWNDIVKGYEYEKNNYIVIDERVIEKKSPELFKTVNIEEFVNFDDIDTLYLDKSYYLIPESKNKKAYVLLREALKKTNKVGVAKIIIRTKESLSLILPYKHALLLYLVHFKEDIREESEVNVPIDEVKNYKVSSADIKIAINLIDEMTSAWTPEKYHNDYQETMKKWLAQQTAKVKKSKNKAVSTIKNNTTVVDFISLLKESMKKNKKTSTKKNTLKKTNKS